MMKRWPNQVLLVGGALAFAIIVAALVDYAITTSKLPEYSPSTTGGDPEVVERTRLRQGYNDRAWLYSVALVAVVGGAAFAALRATPRERRREIFTDLGVVGVVSGIAAVAILSGEPGLFSDIGGAMVWLPAGCFLLAAALGTAFTRRSAPAPGTAADAPGGGATVGSNATPAIATASSGINPVAAMAVGLAALTLILVLIGHSERECGESAPGWSDAMLEIAVLTGLAAGGLGLIALIMRRWLAALVSIPAAALGFFGLLAAACLS